MDNKKKYKKTDWDRVYRKKNVWMPFGSILRARAAAGDKITQEIVEETYEWAKDLIDRQLAFVNEGQDTQTQMDIPLKDED